MNPEPTWSAKLNAKARSLIFRQLSKKELIYLALLFIAYLGTARLGSALFRATNSGSALIWPPAGIATGAMFLGGYALWPAITLASLVNSLISHTPFVPTLAIALGNTLQALFATFILYKFKFEGKISRLRDILTIIFVAFVGMAVAPTIGLLGSWANSTLPSVGFGSRWIAWWLGSVTSVIILTTFLVSWLRPIVFSTWKRLLEGVSAFAALLVIEYFLFWTTHVVVGGVAVVYLLLVPMFWIALRFGPKPMSMAMFLTAVLSVLGLFYGSVTVPEALLSNRLLQIELFIIIIGLIFYIVAAISEERKLSTEILKEHVGQLELALETIRHHALHDPLTGLSNRKSLEERFDLAKATANRHDQKLALLFLDMDRFKNINDSLGHNIGDKILIIVGERLKLCVRESDTVARLGGDEFIIILNEIHLHSDVEVVLKKIMHVFSAPIKIDDKEILVSLSIGAAIFPEAGYDIDVLLKHADNALYKAKDKGKNRYQFYDEDMKSDLHAKLSLEQDLRNAVEKQQLELVYQPYFELKNDKPAGLEALLRWNHAKYGVLEASAFIPLAEDAGIMLALGDWMIQKVTRQIKDWRNLGLNLPVSINLSAKQFVDNHTFESINQELKNFDLSPNFLEVEITERVATQNTELITAKLRELRRAGIAITLDDFGTGYSSLGHLKDFPVQKLKIDKSFVRNVITDQQDSTIIRTIVSMGHTLGIKICAEGIESAPQKALLTSIGCEYGQGHYLCQPLKAEELISWLQHNTIKVRGY